MSLKPAVIFDIDNTLYNFVDFFGPAFRAMLHVLARKSGLEEGVLSDSFREVYSRYHSLEFRYSVDRLPALLELGLPEEEMENLKHLAWLAFSQSRKSRLRPYSGVRETLAWLRLQGYWLIAYSDAGHLHSLGRLHSLGLRQYFHVLAAWGPDVGEIEEDLSGEEMEEWRWFAKGGLGTPVGSKIQVLTFPTAQKKPNVHALIRMIEQFNLDKSNCWVVGDSKEKDLAPARELGLHDVWARYGRAYDSKNWDTLVKVSPWSRSAISKEELARAEFEPSHAIDSPEALVKLVPRFQLELFL